MRRFSYVLWIRSVLCLVMLGFTVQFAHAQNAPVLVAYYSFDDGTANDQTAFANHGSISGHVISLPGVSGYGLVFDGNKNNYVSVQPSESLKLGTNFSISLWYKNNGDTGTSAPFGRSYDRNGLGMWQFIEENQLSAAVYNGRCCGNTSKALGSNTFQMQKNHWYYATITHDNDHVSLYINAQLVDQMPAATFNMNPLTNLNVLYVGRDMFYGFSGAIDEVKIYNSALTSSEVEMEYSQNELFTIYGSVISSSSLSVSGLTVKANEFETTTNQEGEYKLIDLPKGDYVIKVITDTLMTAPQFVYGLNSDLQLNFQQECISPITGFNACELEVGDILLWRGDMAKVRLVAIARQMGGTYFFHSATYIGNGQIAQATGSGLQGVALADQVSSSSLYDAEWSTWWSTDLADYDWAVIRPRASASDKQIVADYQLAQATKSDPEVPYNLNLLDREREDAFNCTQLTWRSYMKVGLDLEFNTGHVSNFPGLSAVITADDLFSSSYEENNKSELVQDNPNANTKRRLHFRVYSPVDLMITDAAGRRSGFDPLTDTHFDEIPNVLYTGAESEPESLSMMIETGTALTVTLTGTGTGSYTLEAIEFRQTEAASSTHTGQTELGLVTQYVILGNESDDLIQPIDVPVIEEKKLFLPLVQR